MAMVWDWNVFRILADVSHTASKCILIFSIHSNRSAEGVSLITQSFYLFIFLARYLPFPWYIHVLAFHTLWNTILKLYYILSSAWIIYIMMRVYARTREKEKAYKLGGICLVGSLLLAPFVMMIFDKKKDWSFAEFSWHFSIILESVCVLPQLLLLRQTTVPTVIDSFYLVTLGSYRGFYLLNWLVRAIKEESTDPASIIFGLIQTALYVDFAWVYWTRQRVKLRGGAVVDSDDMSKGWLVKRLIGRQTGEDHDEESQAAPFDHHDDASGRPRPRPPAKTTNSWGVRGISVSADDGVHDVEADGQDHDRLADPGRFEDGDSDVEVDSTLQQQGAGAAPVEYEDRNSDDGEDLTLPHDGAADGSIEGLSDGSEWRDSR